MENQSRNTAEAEVGNSQWFIILVLTVIVIIGAGLRLYKLGSKDLWLDEFVMRSYAGFDYRFLWNNPYLDGNISYASIVQKFLLELFPENEFFIRLPTALLSIASLLSLYLLGNVLYGIKEGVIATLLLTFSPFHIFMAQEFKLAYMVSATFYPLAIYGLFKGMERDQNRYWFIFIISTLIPLYTHFLVIPSIFSVVTWVGLLFILFILKQSTYWQDVRGHTLSYRFFLKFGLSISLIFIGYLPVISVFRMLSKSPYGYGRRGSADIPFRQQANSDFFLSLFKEYSGSGILLIIFSILILCWLITSLKNKRDILTGVFLSSCIIIPFVAYWVANPSPPLYSRYFIYILPIYLLIVAKGIVSSTELFLNKWPILNRIKFHIILLFAVALNFFTYKPLWSYYHSERTYYKDTTLYLLSHIENRDIIFYKGDQFDIEGILYYLDKFGKDNIFIAPKSIPSLPYRPYFFQPLDNKRYLLIPDMAKKGVIMIYIDEKKDIEALIKKIPPQFRFWFISDKQEPALSSLGIEERQYPHTNKKFFIYFGRGMGNK